MKKPLNLILSNPFLSFGLGTTCWCVPGRTLALRKSQSRKSTKQVKKWGTSEFLISSLALWFFCFGLRFTGSARVRTRNTLHVVGADLSQAWSWDTVLDWRRATARASEPQPHISLSIIIINIFIILTLFYFQFNAHLTYFRKTSKTRVNSTRFQAI